MRPAKILNCLAGIFLLSVGLFAQSQTGTWESRVIDLARPITLVTGQKPPANVTARAVSLNNLGVQRLQDGDYAAAEDLFRQAVNESPELLQSQVNLAICIGHQDRLSEEIDYLNSFISKNGTYAPALAQRGIALFKSGETAAGISDLRRAAELDPRDEITFASLGSALVRTNDFKNAVKAFDRALEIKPRFAVAFNGRGLSWLGLKKYKEAIADLREAARLDENYAEAFNNLGVALRQSGKPKEATVNFKKAVDLRPDSAFLIYNLAVNYVEIGDRDSARRELTRLYKIDSELAEKVNRALLEKYVVQISGSDDGSSPLSLTTIK